MTRPQAEALIVAIGTLGVLVLLTEPWWKPALVEWLLTHPVMMIGCGP